MDDADVYGTLRSSRDTNTLIKSKRSGTMNSQIDKNQAGKSGKLLLNIGDRNSLLQASHDYSARNTMLSGAEALMQTGKESTLNRSDDGSDDYNQSIDKLAFGKNTDSSILPHKSSPR